MGVGRLCSGLSERAGSDGLVFVQFADCRLYGLGYGVMGDYDAEAGVLFEDHSRAVGLGADCDFLIRDIGGDHANQSRPAVRFCSLDREGLGLEEDRASTVAGINGSVYQECSVHCP